MIMLCERCFSPIEEGEPVLRLAHIDRAHPDGTISWVHIFLHTTACTAALATSHEQPDLGAWDRGRGIGSRRG